MRVLFLTQTGPEGASARYRVYAYLPHLERAGIFAQVWPAQMAPAAERSRAATLGHYARQVATRLGQIPRTGGFDVVVLQRDLINHLRPVLERLLARRGVPLVLDVDDAIHLRPPDRPAGLLMKTLGTPDKLAALMPLVETVLAGNEELARLAAERGARRVRLLPTAVDLSRVGPLPPWREPSGPFVLGWIGSPGTAGYLDSIRYALERLGKSGDYRLRVVGAPAPTLRQMPAESLAWSLDTEAEAIASFDVGLMPLSSDPWSQAKCGTKLLEYMARGVPAVASPVGANRAIAAGGAAALLATGSLGWVETIGRLRDDPRLRRLLRGRARRWVGRHYSVERWAPVLIEELQRAAGS